MHSYFFAALPFALSPSLLERLRLYHLVGVMLIFTGVRFTFRDRRRA